MRHQKQHEYRFSIQVPKGVQVVDQVFEAGDKLGVEIEWVETTEGLLLNTVLFVARSPNERKIKQMQKRVQNGFTQDED